MEASIGEVLVSIMFSSKSANLNTLEKSHRTMNLSTYLNFP